MGRLLTADELETFEREGWLLVKDFIPHHLVRPPLLLPVRPAGPASAAAARRPDAAARRSRQ
jgi:hypothetical protein